MGVATYKIKGMNNVVDPADVGAPEKGGNPRAPVFTEGVSIVNMDSDNGGGNGCREGRTLAVAGNFRAWWSDGVKSFVVKDNAVFSFNGSTVTQIATLSDAVSPVAFCPVNDVVVYSNGITLGVIENGISYPCPATIEPFKLPMAPGHILAFLPPYLLSASGDSVYQSDPLRCDQMDSRTALYAKFRDAVKLVLPVDDGCYIITENDSWWFGGTGDEEGGQRLIAPYGGVFGSGVITTAEKVDVVQVSGTMVMWLSTQGICIGGNGGNFKNLSAGKVSGEFGSSAAAMLREKAGLIHYVVSTSTEKPAFNAYEPPTLDTIDQF